MTRCAVLGSPIAHSLSPAMHRAAYAALGLDWQYDAYEVEEAELAGFVAGLGQDVRGLSLTMPLKRVALDLVDTVDPVAELIGAANTMLLEPDGSRSAHNTDVPGLVNAFAIARASPRVSAMLVASEDMVADLGTSRSRRGEELAYVRARFLVECRAAGVEAIDCPYTFSDVKGAVADARTAKRLGYRMKSLVDPSHAKAINAVFSPSRSEIRKAQRIVTAFEKARAAGKERAKVDGALVEVPIYAAAKRLLESLARS